MFGQIGQDQVGRNRGDLIEPGFAAVGFDVELPGKAKAAVGLDAGIDRRKTGIGGQLLGDVCF